ncbi:MAG: glycosyltransferase family 9 protein [Chthoniobacterales bacterium]
MAAARSPVAHFDRILVVRGGAIGDFVLTLPAIKMLRDRFPQSWIEILGHRQIAALAKGRFYANETRSIEDAALARFFTTDADLPGELVNYFASFDLIVSYLFDPDAIFGNNLKRSGARQLISISPKIGGENHAAWQLAEPLSAIGLHLEELAARLYPLNADRDAAERFLFGASRPVLAIHPGSGSSTKNWPLENWRELGLRFLAEMRGATLVLITGEADREQQEYLSHSFAADRVRFAEGFPLPLLAAVLERCDLFLGHDSGISHIAAAVGAHCLLLFGPSNPSVWAPQNSNARVMRSGERKIGALTVEKIEQEVIAVLRTTKDSIPSS